MNAFDIILWTLCGLCIYSSNRAIKHHEKDVEIEKTKNAFLKDENKELKEIIIELENLLDSNHRNNDLGERLMNVCKHMIKSSEMMGEDEIEKLFGADVKKSKLLEEQLKEAEASENFEEATRLRDLINSKNKGNG